MTLLALHVYQSESKGNMKMSLIPPINVDSISELLTISPLTLGYININISSDSRNYKTHSQVVNKTGT